MGAKGVRPVGGMYWLETRMYLLRGGNSQSGGTASKCSKKLGGGWFCLQSILWINISVSVFFTAAVTPRSILIGAPRGMPNRCTKTKTTPFTNFDRKANVGTSTKARDLCPLRSPIIYCQASKCHLIGPFCPDRQSKFFNYTIIVYWSNVLYINHLAGYTIATLQFFPRSTELPMI